MMAFPILQDNGQPTPLCNSTSLTIHITDADDLIPVFTQDVYTIHLPEEVSLVEKVNK